MRRAVADGWFPYAISAEEFAQQADRFRSAAGDAGRDAPAITVWPGSFDPTREHELDWVRRYVDAGASTLTVRLPIRSPADLAGVPDFLSRDRNDVLADL